MHPHSTPRALYFGEETLMAVLPPFRIFSLILNGDDKIPEREATRHSQIGGKKKGGSWAGLGWAGLRGRMLPPNNRYNKNEQIVSCNKNGEREPLGDARGKSRPAPKQYSLTSSESSSSSYRYIPANCSPARCAHATCQRSENTSPIQLFQKHKGKDGRSRKN